MSVSHDVAVDEAPLNDLGAIDFLRDDLRGSQYRIGLIPIESLINQSGSSTPVVATINSALILPLTWKELLVHIRAEADQARSNPTDSWVRFGAVTVSFSRMEVRRSGKPVVLTALQFKVLQYFVENPGRVISRDELLNKVWGYDRYPSTRTVDNTLVRLRQGIEPDPARPIHLLTIHGTGYKFVPEARVSTNGKQERLSRPLAVRLALGAGREFSR